MKKAIIYLVLFLFFSVTSWSQGNGNSSIPLIGENAPSFTAESTNGKIVFPKDFAHQWKILFSHPADFTPVCSSEILELANKQDEFDKLNTKILVLSADGVENHKQWIESLESLNYKNRSTEKIKFPVIGDKDRSIA